MTAPPLAKEILARSQALAKCDGAAIPPGVYPVHRAEGRDGLYPYQALAEDMLEDLPRNKINVLCTAPTGAGKSYLIVAAARVCCRAGAVLCVAEPLIALAEQMHERLTRAGVPRVALLTGPSRKLPKEGEVDVYVCTYEVLARMCYGQHPAVATACLCVVIDEIHFLASERGVVLQEILHACGLWGIAVVALSGTLANEREVATFLSAVNGFDTCIIGMKDRPVRLKYYFWDVVAPAGRRFAALKLGDRRSQSRFDERAVEALGGLQGRQDLLKLLRDLLEAESLPVLVVAFSCRKLTQWAEQAASLPGLLDRQQRSRVATAFDKLLRVVPPEDAELFRPLRALALEGVFMHHSHLPVPYLELVSRLAEKRCAPLVFSSSTLSAGINLPVKTVVLTGFKLPSRQPDGTVRFDVIDPLLLHQLCGRAGRPGYEPEGYVVLVGRGEPGLVCAGALLERPLLPIRPSGLFGPGDVLRALQVNRCLTLDADVFADAELRRLQRAVGLATGLAAEALGTLPPERRAVVARLASGVADLEASEESVSPYVRGRGLLLVLVRQEARGTFRFASAKPVTPGTWGLVLRAPQPPPKKVPLQYASYVLHLRRAAAALVQEEASLTPEELDALAVVVNSELDRRALRDAPGELLLRDLSAQLRADGLLDGEALLTLAGRAGAQIRSCPHPAAAVRFLTTRLVAEERPEAVVEAASLLLGEGAARDGGDEGRASTDVLGAEVAALLPVPTAKPRVTAAVLWASGSSLARIEREVELSCGEVSRHVVRVADLLQEMELAAEVLGLPEEQGKVPLAAAKSLVHRGLPFMRRCLGAEE
jgi:hypothetical protein